MSKIHVLVSVCYVLYIALTSHRVDGVTGESQIASVFKNYFQSNARPNNQSQVDHLNTAFEEKYRIYSEHHNCDCGTRQISLHTVLDAVFSLKPGKSFDDSGLSAEHFHHAPLSLIHRLSTLFDQMLHHSFVPNQFRYGLL